MRKYSSAFVISLLCVLLSAQANGQTRPTVTINKAATQPDPVIGIPIRFTVVFDQNVTGFESSDISFTGSTATGTLAATVSGNGSTYQVSVTGMTSGGLIVASVIEGAATNNDGLTNLASTSTDNAVFLIVQNHDVAVGISPPPSYVVAGTTLGYLIHVLNNGVNTVQGVFTVTDVLPAGTTFVQLINGPLPPGITINTPAVGQGGMVTINFPSLPPSAHFVFTLVVFVPIGQTGTISNTATITGPPGDMGPGNNSSTVTSQISVAPALTCPQDTTIYVNANCFGSFILDANTVSVTGTPSPTISYNWTRYEVYDPNITQGSITDIAQQGSTTLTGVAGGISITATATNNAGTATCNFNVALIDSVAPVVTCSNRTYTADEFCIADVGISISLSDNCTNASPIIYYSPLFNAGGITTGPSLFLSRNLYKGVYYDTIRVEDFSGNQTSCPYTVTVVDNRRPEFVLSTCNEIEVNSDANVCGAIVNFFPVARDNCDGLANVTTNIPSGSVFPLGETTVIATATDDAGNTAQCSFKVRVVDNTPPQIVCPGNQVIYVDNDCYANLPDYTNMITVTDNCSDAAHIDVFQESSTTVFTAGETATVTINAWDVYGNRGYCTFTVTALDTIPPQLTCPANVTKTLAPGQCTIEIPISELSGGGISSIQVTDNCYTPSGISVAPQNLPSGSIFPGGTSYLDWIATDAWGNTDVCRQTINVLDIEPPVISNAPPSVVSLWPPNHQMKDVRINYTVTDNCSATTSLTITSNEPINGTGDGDTSPDWEAIDEHNVRLRAERAANGTGRIYTITITATDAAGNTASQNVEVRVTHNIAVPESGKPFVVGSGVNFTGEFWDKPGNKHTAKWLIDGNTTAKATVAEPSGNKNGKVTGSYKFSSPGVYKLQMNVTDQNGITTYANTNGDLEAIVVIYDPNGGHTYGGGYFDSPAGALTSDPSATGKASYGFAMNYFKNSTYPKGETQFEFKVGDFEFNALNFDYLVISSSMAQFKGTGKIIGGQSGIGFTMTVVDGQLDGTGADKIRMKIYNKNNGSIIYDNQSGASDAALPTQAVGSNSTIVISGTNSSLTKSGNTSENAAPEVNAERVPINMDILAFPNPSANNFSIMVQAGAKEKLSMQVTDMYGRIIETRSVIANSLVRFGDQYRPGTYFVRILHGNWHKVLKLVKLSD
jgi:uncharacterized repeat protein (TIGR01451 family)